MALSTIALASCDIVKSNIDAKIKANGVSDYSLDVVTSDQADKSGGKVVGRCEGNKAIVYVRGQSKVSNGSPNGTTKEASHKGDKSGAATASPDNTPTVQPQIVGRSGQTGG